VRASKVGDERFYAWVSLLEIYLACTNGEAPTTITKVRGLPLGQWFRNRQSEHRHGKLYKAEERLPFFVDLLGEDWHFIGSRYSKEHYQ